MVGSRKIAGVFSRKTADRQVTVPFQRGIVKNAGRFSFLSFVFLGTAVICGPYSQAVDHFVTIGGGYDPKGNQASMEANVQFFQKLLDNRYRPGEFEHHVYFADGSDPGEDVQTAPAAEELSDSLRIVAELFDWETQPITYRDNEVSNVSGSNRAREVRHGLNELCEKLTTGDRLFVYVTAHGGKSKKDDKPFETSIYGWDRQAISSSDLAGWLDRVPESVPVVMVMAQCYCGGFSHTIFKDADAEQPLARGLRCGFFAQRHDLPAAGCRPDISNDREYSSYFWGAFAGQSRSGSTIEGVDRDGDGKISLAEAHIYAVVTSETIDIPLRASDALLRVHSQATEKKTQAESDDVIAAVNANDEGVCESLCYLSGSISKLLDQAELVDATIATCLMEQLGINSEDTIEDLRKRIAESNPRSRRGGRGRTSMRGYRDSLGRLKDEILTRWPEFEKVESMGECSKMGLSLEEIEQEISGWETFQQFQDLVRSRDQLKKSAQQAELTQIKLKRLLHTLETVVYSKNLAAVADLEIVERYHAMLKLEQTTL